jgi:hypothetical protein
MEGAAAAGGALAVGVSLPPQALKNPNNRQATKQRVGLVMGSLLNATFGSAQSVGTQRLWVGEYRHHRKVDMSPKRVCNITRAAIAAVSVRSTRGPSPMRVKPDN